MWLLDKVLRRLCDRFLEINRAYHQYYRDASERKLLRLQIKSKELELERKEYEFARQVADDLLQKLGLDINVMLDDLNGNAVARMKIVFSLYRRLRVLAKFEQSEMIRLPSGKPRDPKDPEEED